MSKVQEAQDFKDSESDPLGEHLLSRLLRSRASLKGWITRIANRTLDGLSSEALAVTEERLRSTFNKYEQLTLEISGSGDDGNIDDVECVYMDVLVKIKTLLKCQSLPTPSAKADTSTHQHMHRTKLPVVEIPTFTGSYSDYRTFIALFDALIDRNDSLEQVQKLYYLRSFLKQEPYDLIKNLPLVSDSYVEARKIIKERYDNEFKISQEHIYKLLDIDPIIRCTATNLRVFVSAVKQQLAALKNLGHNIQGWDAIVASVLLRKLDTVCSREFQLTEHKPTVDNILEFLQKRALALENAAPSNTNNAVGERQRTAGSTAHVAAVNTEQSQEDKQPASCHICKCLHKLHNCGQFKMMSSSDRAKFVHENNLCQVCLNKHTGKCRYYFKCRTCKQKHNTLLHRDDSALAPVTLLSEMSSDMVLLPTARVKLVAKNGTQVHVRALLDSGAQVSLVTNELVQLLGLTPTEANTALSGVGNTTKKINHRVQLEVHSLIKDFSIPVTCFTMEKITQQLPQKPVSLDNLELPPGVVLADKEFCKPGPIHILLGADFLFQVLLPLESTTTTRSHTDSESVNNLVIWNTHFGHVIMGKVPTITTNKVVSLFCTECETDVNEIVSRFWQTEKVPEVYPEHSSESEKCEQIFKETVVLKEKQFEVSLPLKIPLDSVNAAIGDSLSLALKRFYNLETRLHKDPGLYKLYKDFIDEYLALGHGKVIEVREYNLDKDPVYFLPHHPVVKMERKTTKCRVVFDGSMKTSNKISLNNLLLNGPVVQNDLFNILLLFRLSENTLISDVRQMFRAISMCPSQRSLLNILWRDTPNDRVQCIQLQTVTYGLKSSSYLATRCLLELAERYEDEFPKAAFALKHQTYVDDILVSDSKENLMETKNQLCKLLERGGFKLHKWSTNNPEILDDVPSQLKHFDEIDLQKDNTCLKTLGINYNVKDDNFILSSPSSSERAPETKRQILSHISRFFDPLGLAGPIVVGAKVIMQRLWKDQLDWDASPSQDLKDTWLDFYNSLNSMTPIIIPRHAAVQNVKSAQLIGFCDASSSTAYGCCIYLRTVSENGDVRLALLCSKSRVIPMNKTSKNMTVPRLELNSALLLANLIIGVYKNIMLKMKCDSVILYSDSQIVLAWIATNPVKLNPYVGNRVRQISQLTENASWYYVPSELNPADIISRGVLPHEIEHCPLWWKGPDFLHDREYNIPHHKPIEIENLPEVSKIDMSSSVLVSTVSEVTAPSLGFLEKFSDINKMQRVLAYVLRFCKNARKKTPQIKHNFLMKSELDESLSLIIKSEQYRILGKEIDLLRTNKDLGKSNLKALCPFIDKDGLIRVGGRLHNADIAYSQRHPVILPKGSVITELIIRSEHIKNLHAGPRLVLASINQRFWIVHAVREVKKVLHKCVVCFRLKKTVSEQLMGSLPTDRVSAARPFRKVGIDYTGEIQIKQSRVRRAVISKGYVCVFVCFATKAAHLEVVSDLTTEAFLACLKRFISRRGLPSDIYSDNASTFRCARNHINDCYKLLATKVHQNEVQEFAAQKGITFHFIPCYSPIFGGLWEACVKSVKYHLKRVVQREVLSYEQLNTVICQIEAILNSRPLVPLSNDPNDFSYLSPGHFLIGTALNAYPEGDTTETPQNRLTFWKLCTNIQQQFWKIWYRHYLNVLQTRPKWQNVLPNIKIGSLVILREDNIAPLVWPMARVTKVFPGTDGMVRAVEVQTANGKSHNRSVTKICLLPIDY